MGPATLHLPTDPAGPVTDVVAEAWGPGAEAALARVPGMVGAVDHPEAFVAHHPAVAEVVRRSPGRRLPATGTLVEILVPTILEQKVTGLEAWEAFRALCWKHGSDAPGPARLRLPPPPDQVAEMGYADFHPLGVERRRAEVILRVCRRSDRFEALLSQSPVAARRTLEQVPGVGSLDVVVGHPAGLR